MAQRSKSMLEAFQNSKVSKEQAQVEGEATDGTALNSLQRQAAAVGGAVQAGQQAGDHKAAKSPAAETQQKLGGGIFGKALAHMDASPSVEDALHGLQSHQKLRWTVVAGLMLATFALGYALGETREVAASVLEEDSSQGAGPFKLDELQGPADDDGAGFQGSTEDSGVAADTSGLSDIELKELAFYDAKNRFTIVAETIPYSSADPQDDIDAAWAFATHLNDNGFVSLPFGKDSSIVVLVNPSPSTADLKPVLTRLKKLNGPPPSNRADEFFDAFIDNTNKHLDQN